jgi:hypothetical protein
MIFSARTSTKNIKKMNNNAAYGEAEQRFSRWTPQAAGNQARPAIGAIEE